jgi:muramoyltetrapeptide carboxypeptidase
MTGIGARPGALRFPPALAPGDTVYVVAPSSGFDALPVWLGMGWLASRYRVRFDAGLFARQGYLAGSDERRTAELRGAMEDPEVKAIIAARGGYGANRIVQALDWETFAARPRWLVGFSDFTALHVEAARVGVASVHGPVVSPLGRSDEATRAAFVDVLEHPRGVRRLSGLQALCEGSFAGPLFGGNLSLLHACACAGRLAPPAGSVFLLEDVGERPYRIDRMLTTLLVGGHFARAGAILLGDFTSCEPNADGVTVEMVVQETLLAANVPVVAGLPVGHGARNQPLVLGGLANVEASRTDAIVTFGEPGA